MLCVIWFCHDFSDLTQGALKLDLFYCWIMTSGICKTNELQPRAKDFKAIFKWNLGHTEVNSKTLYSFFGDKNTWLLKHELSVGTYGLGSVWLEFLAWVSKERNIHSLRMMESPSHPSSGKGAGADSHRDPEHPKHFPTHLLHWQSHSAAFLPHSCNLWLPHLPWFKH